MTESSEKPTLNAYRSMIRETHAPTRLQSSVLEQAAKERARQTLGEASNAAAQERQRTRSESTARPSSSTKNGAPASGSASAATRRSILHPAAACAACLALAVALLATGSAIGWPGSVPLDDRGSAPAKGNSFMLCAYAAENPEGAVGKAVLLNSSDFRGGGGHSGRWYNPADQTFWNYPWVGYKYHFSLTCTGSNVETLTYEIEGERSYFEIVDREIFLTPRENRAEGEHAFNYTKTVTFDYDNQQPITEERSIGLYIGYPLSDAGMQAVNEFYAGSRSDEINKQLDTAHEAGAAKEMANSRLKLTATFSDGSTQTKTFIIKPIDDFDQVYSAYWDARNNQTTTDGPEMPKLYTITEIFEA